MSEIPSRSIHLVVTSPPYYNAPFDYPGLFKSYEEYLELIRSIAKELHRVLADGRIACFVTQDVRVEGTLYPICSDIIKIMIEEGFKYRDKIIWRKPEGYIRISRRSGILVQHPYPMYFHPDNIYEEIIIFQKGNFNYSYVKSMSDEVLEESKIDVELFNREKWYLTVWDITNVLPLRGRLEEGIAAFPEEIPRRLIKLFSFKGETVLDPFLGSGTTMKVAKELGRNSYGYEIDLELKDIILEKVGYWQTTLTGDTIEYKIRDDAKRLRTFLQEKVKAQRGTANNRKQTLN
jgi:DNA modification methylase